MNKETQLTDSREVGHVYCLHCRRNHALAELRKEIQGATEFYFCHITDQLLAKSKPDGRVVPILGDAIG